MKLAILMVLATSCCLQTALGLSQNGDVDIASETNELWRPVAFRDKRELFEGDLVLDLDEGHLKELLEEEAGRAKIPLVLPSGRIVSFKVRKSDIMPPKLAEKYPEILAFEGQSVDEHPPMQVTLQLSPTKRFRAFIQGAAGDFLIDPKKGDETHYVSQPFTREHRATHAEVAKHHCKTMNITADEHASGRRLVGSDTHAVEYTFVIGMVANGEYSTYHGGTKASVLAEIVTLMSRVNGIFKRELGTFFQLHEEVDRLICLEPCMIPNTAAVLDEVGGVNDFLESISFSLDKADIFHTLTTGAGGVACLGSLCHSTYKSCGVTGLDNPTADAYYVDYVSHEVGHQLAGHHSWTDCPGQQAQHSTEAGVEPGSGTTIMSYAGICATSITNLQYHSDPYFGAKNLEQMSSFLASVSCGQATVTTREKPQVTLDSTCTIPINTPFQVKIKDDTLISKGQFTFETVDLHDRKYDDRTWARFRSWHPTDRQYRDFPNMYYQIHGKSSVYDEVLPVSRSTITIRATARHSFSQTQLETDDHPDKGFGTFSYKDITVDFVDDVSILSLHNTGVLTSATKHNFTWDVAGTDKYSPQLDIMIALDNMPVTTESSFDYTQHVRHLDWVKVATVENVGFANVDVPYLSGKPMNTTVHVLLKSRHSESCSFYALSAHRSIIDYRDFTVNPTSAPTSDPTKEPTTYPTKAPTNFPSTNPSPAPTNPTNTPSISPTNSPSTRPSTSPTSDAPTPYPTGRPTVNPTSIPTVFPTMLPTAQPSTLAPPTKAPTEMGSKPDELSRTSSLVVNLICLVCLVLGFY